MKGVVGMTSRYMSVLLAGVSVAGSVYHLFHAEPTNFFVALPGSVPSITFS